MIPTTTPAGRRASAGGGLGAGKEHLGEVLRLCHGRDLRMDWSLIKTTNASLFFILYASRPSSSMSFVTSLITSFSRTSACGSLTLRAMRLSTMPRSRDTSTPIRAHPRNLTQTCQQKCVMQCDVSHRVYVSRQSSPKPSIDDEASSQSVELYGTREQKQREGVEGCGEVVSIRNRNPTVEKPVMARINLRVRSRTKILLVEIMVK